MGKLSIFRSLAYIWGLRRRSTTATQSSNTKLNDENSQGRYHEATSTGDDETLQLQISPRGDTLTLTEQPDISLSFSDNGVRQPSNSAKIIPFKAASLTVFQRGDQTQREHDINRIAVAFALGGSSTLKDIFVLLIRLLKTQNKVSFSRIDKVTEFARTCGPQMINLGEIYGKDVVESSHTAIELLSLLQDLCTIISTLPIEDLNERTGADIDRLVSMLNDKLSEIQQQYPQISSNGMDQENQHPMVDIILEASVTILDLFRDGCDLVPVACVKPAVGLACTLIKAVKKTRTNHQDMRDLSESVSEFVISVVAFLSENIVEIPQSIESALQEFNSSLRDIVETCLILANKSFISRLLQQGKDSDTIGGLKSKLHMAIEKFQLKSHILQHSDFRVVTRSINDKLDYEVIRSLPSNPLFEGKREDFLPDIQEDILKHIATWIEDESSSPVFLLLASAGFGKSCISHQLVYKLMDSGRLAAQMFMSRGSVLQQNLVAIFQTLARDLGTMHPGTVPKIASATRLGGSSHDSPTAYFQKYILEPVRSLSLSQPLILILDALDECEVRKLILQVFSEISDFSGIKIILTSRPGSPDITEFTKSPSVVAVNLKRMTQSKMELYISLRFKRIQWSGEPPSDSDISNLANLAGGLIIWASTSCNFIENDVQEDDPSVILQKIVSSSTNISSDDQLTTLYNTTLMHLFGGKQAERFIQVFRMMLVVNEAMSVDTFSRAFGVSVRQIKALHSALSALEIYESDDKNIILPATTRFHLSFLEYITQPQSSSLSALTSPFYIDPTTAHYTVSTLCLSRIQSLSVSDPVSWETISYAALDSHIQYAVCHWPFHLINSVQADRSLETLAREGIDIWYPFYLLASQALSLILEGTGHRQAIDKVNSFHAHSWQLFDVTGKDKSEASSDYGLALWRRYERDGSLQDLEESIKMEKVFLSFHQTSDIRRAHALSRLGHSIWGRIPTTKSCPQDIDDAVSTLNEALEIYSKLSFPHYRTLSALSSALRARFEKTGSDTDLDYSITIQKDLLATATPDFIDPIRARNNLANCLSGRFEAKKLMSDLNEAISLLDDILGCRPIGHPFRSVTLNNLACCLERRYNDTGFLADLERAILMNDEALILRPHPHTYRAQTLINLASCLKSRYDNQGGLSDLEKSISCAREAVELRPASHSYHHFTVNRLGQYLHCRFMHSNEPKDLDEAIMLLTGVVSSYPSSYREYPIFQNNLSVALRTRYEESAVEHDLDNALAMQRQALASSSKQSVSYPNILSQVGITLLISYTRKRSSELLTEIIKINREANSLRVESHPYRYQALNNLAKSLHYAFQETGRQEDLDEARTLYHESLLLCPPPHPSRPIALEGLAQLARSYFELTDSLEHLNEWIDRCRELFTLVSSSRARYKITAEGFQKALHIRFERKGDSKDLDEISH